MAKRLLRSNSQPHVKQICLTSITVYKLVTNNKSELWITARLTLSALTALLKWKVRECLKYPGASNVAGSEAPVTQIESIQRKLEVWVGLSLNFKQSQQNLLHNCYKLLKNLKKILQLLQYTVQKVEFDRPGERSPE